MKFEHVAIYLTLFELPESRSVSHAIYQYCKVGKHLKQRTNVSFH